MAFSFNPVKQVAAANTNVAIPINRWNGISVWRIVYDAPGYKNVTKPVENCDTNNSHVEIPSQLCNE